MSREGGSWERGSRLRLPRQRTDQAAEGLRWGSGRGRKRVRGRKRKTASRTSLPANREGKAARGVAHRRGAKAGAGDGGRKARATSLRPDRWKGLESQAQRPEVVGGGGSEGTRANEGSALAAENGNGGGGCEGMKRAGAQRVSWGMHKIGRAHV